MFNESNDLKKAFNVRLNCGGNYPLSREMVYCFFDIPAVEAARIMCVSLSLLKKIRGWVKVERWPCSLIHSGEFDGLTRVQVVQGRDEVISRMEKDYRISCSQISGSRTSGSHKSKQTQKSEIIENHNGAKLALKILKEAREYAAIYLSLVIPDAGRKPKATRKVDAFDSELKAEPSLNDERRVKELMESMKPRQVVKRKTRVSVLTTVEPEDCFWPISITQEINFDQLFTSDDVDDELKLGPMTLSTKVSTTLMVGRGGSVNSLASGIDFDFSGPSNAAGMDSEDEDFGLLGK